MYKVTYTVKNEDGYIVDKVKKFDQAKSAIAFMRQISKDSNLYGRPIFEND